MKRITLLILLAVFLSASPVFGATVKAPTVTQLQAQVVSLKKQVADLQVRVKQYENYLQPMVNLVTSTKAENDQLRSQLQQSYAQTQQAIGLVNSYKAMCTGNSTPVPTPAATALPAPTPAPVIKCFTGTTVECFDYASFPASLIVTLNGIAQKPITMSSISGQQLRAIHDYLGY